MFSHFAYLDAAMWPKCVRHPKIQCLRKFCNERDPCAFFHALFLLLEQRETESYFSHWSKCPLYKSNKELRMKHLCFCVFSRLCNQIRDIFGDTIIYLRRTQIKRTLSLTGKRSTTQINLGNQVERWREVFTCLDVCDRKQAKLLPGT